MTPLAHLLRETISRTGPISTARFMAEALAHPEHGYYLARDPLGASGDFITAPEVSQMFGELIGLWCVDCWMRLGMPEPFVFAELGPGRGTLMADALRAARVKPAFLKALELHLVETSPVLRRHQAETLAAWRPSWHDRIDDLPARPMLLIANEFFDALPIRQFERTTAGWRERLVGIDSRTDGFLFVLADRPPEASVSLPDPAPIANGAIVEIAPLAEPITEFIAAGIAEMRGAALIIDYGYAFEATERDTRRDARRDAGRDAWTGTLQAVRGHRTEHPLADPGDVDITAHVDFAALRRFARKAGAGVHGPIAQGLFLEALGIKERAARLARAAPQPVAAEIAMALHRLTAPSAMGRLFQALAISHPALGTPSGFA